MYNSKNSFINRNKIRSKDGTIMLSVPLATKGKFGDLAIERLTFAESSKWRRALGSLQMNYSKSPFFNELSEPYRNIYVQKWDSFMPFVKALLYQYLLDLRIETQIVFSSQIATSGNKSDLIPIFARQRGQKLIYLAVMVATIWTLNHFPILVYQ